MSFAEVWGEADVEITPILKPMVIVWLRRAGL
jgi:hypothetical protein